MRTQIDLVKKYGLAIRGHMGQHLLIDPNIQRKIVDLLEISNQSNVLEIGPGLGALTWQMLDRGARVVAIEKDKRFAEALNRECEAKQDSGLTVVRADVLKTDLAEVLAENGLGRGAAIDVISNLPYYVTGPVFFHLLSFRRLFSKAVLMMQKEVAARMVAEPGTKAYGKLSLVCRAYAEVEHCFNVSPRCFTPKPEVESSVLKFRFHEKLDEIKGLDQNFLMHVIHIAFSQRRKKLIPLLAKDNTISHAKAQIEAIFQDEGISTDARGEELLFKDFLSLSTRLSG